MPLSPASARCLISRGILPSSSPAALSDLLRLLCKPVPLTAAEEGGTKPRRLCARTSSVWVVVQEVTEGPQGPAVLSIHPSLCPRQLQMSFQLVVTFISERDYYKLQQRQLNLINICPDEYGLDHSLPYANCCDLPALSNLSALVCREGGWVLQIALCPCITAFGTASIPQEKRRSWVGSVLSNGRRVYSELPPSDLEVHLGSALSPPLAKHPSRV